MENKYKTIEDLQRLLANNGAGEAPQAVVRIWKYEELIPNKEFLKNLNKLGGGAQGQVYAINIQGLDYALKIMQQGRGQQKVDLINSFYNECSSLLSVNHPRVLRLLGVVINIQNSDDDCLCHLTNYQSQGSLYNLIQQKKLFSDIQHDLKSRFYAKLKILGQIAEGINAIHLAGLIHRDIKSLNILLDENNAPKIADLGMASLQQFLSTQDQRGTLQ